MIYFALSFGFVATTLPFSPAILAKAHERQPIHSDALIEGLSKTACIATLILRTDAASDRYRRTPTRSFLIPSISPRPRMRTTRDMLPLCLLESEHWRVLQEKRR